LWGKYIPDTLLGKGIRCATTKKERQGQSQVHPPGHQKPKIDLSFGQGTRLYPGRGKNTSKGRETKNIDNLRNYPKTGNGKSGTCKDQESTVSFSRDSS